MLTVPAYVRHAGVDGRTAILDLRAGRWVMLDPAASLIWQALVLRGGTDGLAEEIAAPRGADPAALAPAIDRTVAALLARGLLADTTRPPARRRPWWRRTGGAR
ncbi:PqqD family peptide modification chaperone [Kitasatospora sp. NPDC015120]|uniref:PqqD family peptide modification chaperone n=1 Tax=Kitasatospora sp. NPDC015120 TaxID=3364023 RepID=UPI0036F483D4